MNQHLEHLGAQGNPKGYHKELTTTIPSAERDLRYVTKSDPH